MRSRIVLLRRFQTFGSEFAFDICTRILLRSVIGRTDGCCLTADSGKRMTFNRFSCRVDPASVETQVAELKARLQAAATAAAALPAVQPEK